MLALQLVSIEELEILLILVPLIILSHIIEASLAAVTGVALSVSTALMVRKNFEKVVAGKLKYLKIISGLFLLALAVVLFVEA